MDTSEIVLAVIIFTGSAISLILSVLQFLEKGIPLNNAYFYASKEERLKMNRKPYYRQSAVVLLVLCLVFVSVGLNIITKKSFFIIIEYILIAAIIIYGIVSSKKIEKSEKNR